MVLISFSSCRDICIHVFYAMQNRIKNYSRVVYCTCIALVVNNIRLKKLVDDYDPKAVIANLTATTTPTTSTTPIPSVTNGNIQTSVPIRTTATIPPTTPLPGKYEFV